MLKLGWRYFEYGLHFENARVILPGGRTVENFKIPDGDM